MILADINVLVYAFRRESLEHDQYLGWLENVVATEEFALVDHCLAGFVRIVTNSRIYADPAPTEVALQFVDRLRGAPKARPIASTAATWNLLNRWVVGDGGIRGNLVPDAYLAAMAVSHGARLATNDLGFARFPSLHVVDPLGR